MDINATDTGASTYAMKKAIEMPKLVLDLIQQIPNPESQALNTESRAAQQKSNFAAITGKGKIVDIVA